MHRQEEENDALLQQQQEQCEAEVVDAAGRESDRSALDEWTLVNDDAEIIASVSTNTVHEEEDAHEDARASDDHSEHAQEQEEEETEATAMGSERSREEEQVPTTHAEPAHTTESAPSASTNENVPEGYLRIRLRAGEEIRPAWFKATQIVDDFVAEFFADAVAEGKKIRLIYMGMLLIRDRSMGKYGIEEDGVIHCVIAEAPPTPHPQATQNSELKGFADPTNALLIITGVFLYGLWTLLYHFPHLFTWKSIILLSLFSAMHISATASRFMSG